MRPSPPPPPLHLVPWPADIGADAFKRVVVSAALAGFIAVLTALHNALEDAHVVPNTK